MYVCCDKRVTCTLPVQIKAGVSESRARDAAGSDLVAVCLSLTLSFLMPSQAARAHCLFVILDNFTEAIDAIPKVRLRHL